MLKTNVSGGNINKSQTASKIKSSPKGTGTGLPSVAQGKNHLGAGRMQAIAIRSLVISLEDYLPPLTVLGLRFVLVSGFCVVRPMYGEGEGVGFFR